MTHPTFLPASAEPTNLIITTPPGVGTIAILEREISHLGLDRVLIPAQEVEAEELFVPRFDGKNIVDDVIDFVEVIVIDEASRMRPEMREMAQELLLERSLRGYKLTRLKHVVLVYQLNAGEPEPEYPNLSDRFETVRIAR